MRQQIISKTGTSGSGLSSTAIHDHRCQPFNIGIGCVTSGTVNYTLQHTFDNAMDTSITPTWFNHDDVALVAASANASSNYAYPCAASRVVVNSGTGTVTVTFLQAGFGG